MVDHINNGEEGFSVREKLNTVIDRTNTLNGIENQVELNKNLSQQNKVRIDQEIRDRIDGDADLQGQVNDLESGKSDKGHGHEISDINGLDDALDDKQDVGNYVTEAPDDGYQYARQFLVADPDGEGDMTWTIVRAGGGGGGGAGMVIRAAPPEPDDRVMGMQWLNELTGEVWVWDGVRWLEFPAEGGIHKGGGGIPFPAEELRTGQWLAYRQTEEVYDENDGSLLQDAVYEWGVLTTDMVATNPDMIRGGTLTRWDAELDSLTDQLKVNRFLWDRLTDLEDTVIGFGFREIPNGNRTLKHDPALNNHGGSVNPEDCLIYHLNVADCTTDPCQKLVFVCPEGQELLDHYEDTQQEGIFKLVQINPDSGEPLRQTMRGVDGGSMSGNVFSIECDQVYGDSLLDGVGVQILVRTAAAMTEEWVSKHFVHREGGDSMEGPLNISSQPGTDSRETRRINTLGLYSNSNNSALQLGTATTKIYVGENDTSFNGPIKVSEITDRGNGIKIEAPLNFGQQSELMRIDPNDGTTQNINLFGSNSTNTETTLKFNILGATWKNAIEFESGGSGGKETMLRIDSNKGLKARYLNMDNTKITSLANPNQPTDAVNLRYMEGITDTLQNQIDGIEPYDDEAITNALAAETQARIDGDVALSDAVDAEKNSRIDADNQLQAGIAAEAQARVEADNQLDAKINAIDMAISSQGVFRKAPSTYPDDPGEFTMLNAGGSSTNTITGARTIWVADRNAAGNQIDIGSWNGGTVDFVDKDGEIYVFPFISKSSGAPDTNGLTFWNLTISSGMHSGGNTEMPSNQDYYFKLQGLAPPGPGATTRNLKLENPSDTRILTGMTTQADANEVFATALSGLVDEDLNPISGDATVNETHMIGGKGSWHNSHTGVPTDRFYGLNYSDTGRNYLDNYTFGIVVGKMFGNEQTTNVGWQNGSWVEVYDSGGGLIFTHEIDRVRYDSDGQLKLLWDWAPTMYKGDSLSYSQTLWLKIHGLTNRKGRGVPPPKEAPPEDLS